MVDYPNNGRFINHHCTCVRIGGTGLMIEGASGSGKTSLALGLLEAAIRRNVAAEFICDDQALLANIGGRLLARSPDKIAGKIEVYGYGIVELDFVAESEISLLCQFVDPEEFDRLPERKISVREGIEIARINVPRKHEAQAVRILLAHLGLPIIALR